MDFNYGMFNPKCFKKFVLNDDDLIYSRVVQVFFYEFKNYKL